jgi:hypothetical protein
MFALQSCKGFSPNTYHMWCCTRRQCNIEYTEQAVKDLGFSLPFAMEVLTCHELQPSTGKSTGQRSSGFGRAKLLVLLLASGLATATVLVLVLLGRQLKVCQGNRMIEDGLQKEQSIQVPKIQQERSHNRKAMVVLPHERREIDLQAQAESSITVSVDSIPNGKMVSNKLMVRAVQISRSVFTKLQIAMQLLVTSNKAW